MNTEAIAMKKTSSKQAKAEVVREYGPFGDGGVHGVTYDGKLVWFARTGELIALDPESGKVERRLSVPAAGAGTAFDGENIYQLAAGEILVVRPSDGQVLRRLPAPGGEGNDSGMAYADGYLWVGQYRNAKIVQIDAKSGEVVKTLSSDRWVTGVSCVEGNVWHATSRDADTPAELRRLSADGTVEEVLELPAEIFVSGLEADRRGGFFCGGGPSGRVRLVKRGA